MSYRRGSKPGHRRSTVMLDKPVIGAGLPMVSKSGIPIQLNDVLYTASLEKNYSYGDREIAEPSVDLRALRVIQINYKMRYIRLREAGGCESNVDFSGNDGCSYKKFYHSPEDAVVGVIDQCAEEARKCADKVGKYAKLASMYNKKKKDFARANYKHAASIPFSLLDEEYYGSLDPVMKEELDAILKVANKKDAATVTKKAPAKAASRKASKKTK